MAGIEVMAVGPGVRLREGRYQLVRVLGTGGMATVWEAEDTRLGRSVAVKVLSDVFAHDDEYLARFRREARLAAGLSHPGLVNVFDFEATADRPYLVMELIDGGTLAERLREEEPLDTDDLAGDLLDALAFIHRAGIIHRDVKPANVLLRSDGQACLTDFGVADPQDATSITQTGQIPGTKDYMAPELLEGEPASELTDLYSCGVVLREAIGQAGGSARLIALADEMAAADPGERPRSALAAQRRLARPPAVLPGPLPGADPEPVPAPGPAPEPTQAPFPENRREIRITPRALGAAAVAVGALLVAVIAVGGDESTPQTAAGDAQQAERSAKEKEKEPDRETTVPTASGDDAAKGASLNDQGFDLLNAGDPEAAVPVLERAVRAFPPGTSDVNYGFALYNLGHALRLAGEPERAIPVLEERLEIPNQTDVVRAELDQARAAAGE
jgi:tetratricopeptide (TPR) repeat protein